MLLVEQAIIYLHFLLFWFIFVFIFWLSRPPSTLIYLPHTVSFSLPQYGVMGWATASHPQFNGLLKMNNRTTTKFGSLVGLLRAISNSKTTKMVNRCNFPSVLLAKHSWVGHRIGREILSSWSEYILGNLKEVGTNTNVVQLECIVLHTFQFLEVCDIVGSI